MATDPSLPSFGNNRVRQQKYEVGALIPLHYHGQMLLDNERLQRFRLAIAQAVRPGDRVLELGGGTGVLSWFAAQQGADVVWCVEALTDLAEQARRFLDSNPEGERIHVIAADAFRWLPPEPVDVVICEMLHAGLLREKQLSMIEAFKQHYLAAFGGPLPRFIPEATLLASQLVEQNYDFYGYVAPIPLFQYPYAATPGTQPLSAPQLFATVDYTENNPLRLGSTQFFTIQTAGLLNALRIVTKNVLTIGENSDLAVPVEWHNQYLVLPLPEPVDVVPGDCVMASFSYRAGASLASLSRSLIISRLPRSVSRALAPCAAA